MFFRKKVKLQDFLKDPFLEVVLNDGVFRYEDFYEDFKKIVKENPSTLLEHGTGSVETDTVWPGVERDYFISGFLGTFLWLLKYRTLSANRSSPRKLAFLDLLFDIEIQKLIAEHLGAYYIDKVQEVYDLMDILCKKQYTGDLPKGEPPPFLVSPIWGKNASPHPFRTAAVIFRDLMLKATPVEAVTVPDGEPLIEELYKRFTAMTAAVEKPANSINFSWSTPQEKDEPVSDPQQQGKT